MREAGLEPARPEWTLEPESSESANSTTRALFAAVSRLLQYITTGGAKSQDLFSLIFFRTWCTLREQGAGFGKIEPAGRTNAASFAADGGGCFE